MASTTFSEVYHASPIQGLTLLVPRVATHGMCWVYAADDIVMASLFLGREGGDFTCGTGTLNDKPYLVERFAGAFDLRYTKTAGSLYVLAGTDFVTGMTAWVKDLVCSHAVTPLREIQVPNVRAHLLQLAEKDQLTIKYFPERYCIPDDDSDLIERAVKRCRAGNREQTLEQICKYHPDLLSRVVTLLEGST